MPYDSLVARGDAAALIPQEVLREILKTPPEGSSVTRLARRLRDMQRAELRMPVLSTLPNAYFVGEKGRQNQTFGPIKQTAEMAWDNKFIHAEEIATIVPIPENVVMDSEYDLWGEIIPYVREAIFRVVDQAILYGTSGVDVPANWPDGIITAAPADHLIEEGSVAIGGRSDMYNDIFAVGGVLNQVEEDGYFVNGHLAAMRTRALLRQLRDDEGQPLFVQDMKAETPFSLDGTPLLFPRNGAFDPDETILVSGDWSQIVWAVRQDVTLKVLTEGVITDASNPRQIIHNLAQDDMVALRVVFRMGWQMANPINALNPDNDTRYPFAALVPASS